MMDFIRGTVEYKEWGWNAVIIGSIGTVFFTIIEMWALWRQAQTIRKKKSGESCSVSWFTYDLFAFTVFFIYGTYISGVAVMFNGFLALFQIPILIGLGMYKGFTKWEKVQFLLLSLMIPAIIILPWKSAVLLVSEAGYQYALLTQLYTLWRSRKTGALEIRLLVTYVAATIFWVMYSFAIQEWALEILTTANLTLLSLTTILWFVYKYREKKK